MKNQKSLPKRVLGFCLTLLLVFLALFFALYGQGFHLDGLRRWIAYGELERSAIGETTPFVHGGGDQPSFALVGNGVMMVSHAGSRYYSFSGETYGEQVLSFSNPVLHRGSNTGVLYDAGGRSLQVYGKNDTLFTLGLAQDAQILSARLNAKDWLTVSTQQSGYRGVVTVYNTDYQKVVEISLSSASIMDAVVSPDNSQVAVVTIDQQGGIFQSEILLYRLGEEEAYHRIPLPQRLVLDMDYEATTLWLLCDDGLLTVDLQSWEQFFWSFGGQYLKGSGLGGDGFATLLLGQYRAGIANRLVTVDAQGQILGEKSLGESPLAVDSTGAYIAYLSGEHLVLYHPDLQEYASLADPRHSIQAAVAEDGTVLLASQQEAWLYLPQGGESEEGTP